MKKPIYSITFEAFYPFYQICAEHAYITKESEREFKAIYRKSEKRRKN